MKHRLATALSASSLLLALGVAVLWARSYVVHDVLTVVAGGRHVALHSTSGQFLIDDDPSIPAGYRPGVTWQRQDDVIPYGSNIRSALVRFKVARFNTARLWSLPQWPLVALAAVPPAVGVVRRRRRAPVLPGACPHCGYDLRATPDRCPECGASAA